MNKRQKNKNIKNAIKNIAGLKASKKDIHFFNMYKKELSKNISNVLNVVKKTVEEIFYETLNRKIEQNKQVEIKNESVDDDYEV